MNPEADVAAEAEAYRPAFGHLALLAQLPGIDVVERVTAEKGSALSERELVIVDERTRAAHAWLEAYAPPDARVEIQRDALPDAVADLTTDQRAYCAALADGLGALPATEWVGEGVQSVIFATAKERGIAAGAAFAALYAAFLGGPPGRGPAGCSRRSIAPSYWSGSGPRETRRDLDPGHSRRSGCRQGGHLPQGRRARGHRPIADE